MADIDESYIVDASVVIAWLLPLEVYKSFAENILQLYRQNKVTLLAPIILPCEVINSLKTALLRRRITKSEAFSALRLFTTIKIKFIGQSVEDILHTAIIHDLSAYDSMYVSLALSHSHKLITGDKILYKKMKSISRKKIIWIENLK